MAEYIEREAALNQFEDTSSAIPEKWARIRIEEIPAADVVEELSKLADNSHVPGTAEIMGMVGGNRYV